MLEYYKYKQRHSLRIPAPGRNKKDSQSLLRERYLRRSSGALRRAYLEIHESSDRSNPRHQTKYIR
jgi:hypothetical protein